MRASGEGLRFRHVFVAAAKLSDDENTAETAGWSPYQELNGRSKSDLNLCGLR